MKILTILFSAIFLLTACAPNPAKPTTAQPPVNASPNAENSYAPLTSDSTLQRGNAYLNSTNLLTMESNPPQFALNVKGDLPTPCNQLRAAIGKPDSQNKISIDLYSVIDGNALCAEMIKPFEATLSLGSFPKGHYTIWINGKQVAEFDA